MFEIKVDGNNRDKVQERYINYLLSRMDFWETREQLRDYINTEKILYSNDDLLDEIKYKGSDAINEVFHFEGELVSWKLYVLVLKTKAIL